MKHFDYLLVGQGIAGTMLDHFFSQHNCRVGIIDDAYDRASSKVAAGLINPVTGRRYVKSWRVDELLPVARETYRTMEQQLGIAIYRDLNIIRSLFNHREENDWLARSGEAGYDRYLLDEVHLGNYATFTQPVFSYGEVQYGAQVDLSGLIQAYRKKLREEERLKEKVFDYQLMKIEDDGVQYEDWQADAILFCEGARIAENPFFNYLPFRGDKGEILIVRIPGVNFEKAFKHKVFIIPIGGNEYWIGSTYEGKYSDDLPSSEGRSYLEKELREILKTPYTVIKHLAAIRPTVKDRRPFLGRHPQFDRLILFNGLGTKGTSLAPFWARHLVDHLLHDQPLDPLVDIQRFSL